MDWSKIKIDYECYFDGSCEPINPGGNMGFGSLAKEDGIIVWDNSGCKFACSTNSNNVAEYLGILSIFNWIVENEFKGKHFLIKGDSKLVIQQMSGYWRIKFGLYASYAHEAKKILNEILLDNKVYFKWIPRDLNWQADALSRREKMPMVYDFCI